MYEQPQRLARTADRSNASLQILPLDGPHPVSGELFAIFRFEADGEAVLLGAVSRGHRRNDLSPRDKDTCRLSPGDKDACRLSPGDKDTCQRQLPPGVPAKAPPGPEGSTERILKTAESHWPRAQCEP